MRNSFRLMIVWMALVVATVVLVAGCANMQGDVDQNQPPNVDFVNVHDSSASVVYDFAPVIHWKGDDPDGFVQYYSYADITDSAAIRDPEGFLPLIPDEVWKDTIATQARIYLLTQAGDTTEHIFYLRCVDNEGAISAVKYRPFYRTNRPPNVPIIGVTGEDERNFATRRVITNDTLFSAPSVTNIYPGISFSWRGTDPDDKALFTIPLQYRAILVKSPSDTIFVTNWSDNTDITLTDLQTGNYTLNVWSRDDGYTLSVNPARIEFYVIRPTFEHNLLVVMEETNAGQILDTPNPDDARAYYDQLLRDVNPELENVNFNLDDGIDVKFLMVTNLGSSSVPNVPSRSLVSQYKMVLFLADQFKVSPFQPMQYREAKAKLVDDYLSVGGRVWMQGRMLGLNDLGYETDADTRDVLLRFFGINDIVGPATWLGTGQKAYAEFIGTRNAVEAFPALEFDTTKIAQNWILDYLPNNFGLSGVERVERAEVAQTTQYLVSNTAGNSIDITNEDSEILQRVNLGNGVSFDYPPNSTTCYIQTANSNVIHVDRVVNYTLQQAGAVNAVGEVVFTNNNIVLVSYDEGQQWSDADSLQVDYTYDPISEYHLKPCEIRYEGIQTGTAFNELRFRTAFTTFSYYFVNYDEAREAWRLMLDWFYNPNLNSANIIIRP